MRRFDGWEPRRRTRYRYRGGRLVESVTRTEPEWTQAEAAWMLALSEAESNTCSGCGGWLPETIDSDESDWVVQPPHRCGRCTALGSAQDSHAKDHQHLHALRWPVERRE